MASTVAALDCGSNSTRLFIVDGARGARTRRTRITRLSAGVDEHATLREDAMERTFAVLREYRRAMDDERVDRGLLVATSAVRDARNGQDFLARAGEIVGVEARILSGNEEATFSYDGATADLPPSPRPPLIVDIGGGSTELAVVVDDDLRSFSMQLGCVRVAERALGVDVVTPERRVAAEAMIERELDRAFASEPRLREVVGAARLVGLAGTVATLVALERAQSTYDRAALHHQTLTRDQVEYWRERLGAETPAVRLTHPGMTEGREDVLTAGLFVLSAVMARFEVDEVLSSESDILDGMAASMLAQSSPGSASVTMEL
ncbi:MAG: exopolyphosphatase [Acidobacteriota bacterium]|nr:exopolyphosphatase [Acidobacteriota bacterium]